MYNVRRTQACCCPAVWRDHFVQPLHILSRPPNKKNLSYRILELQFDKFASGDVDLYNSTLLRRFHEVTTL